MFALIMTSLKEYLHLCQSRMPLLYCSWQSASATPTGIVELNFYFIFLELQESSMSPYHEFVYMPSFPYLGVSLQISIP